MDFLHTDLFAPLERFALLETKSTSATTHDYPDQVRVTDLFNKFVRVFRWWMIGGGISNIEQGVGISNTEQGITIGEVGASIRKTNQFKFSHSQRRRCWMWIASGANPGIKKWHKKHLEAGNKNLGWTCIERFIWCITSITNTHRTAAGGPSPSMEDINMTKSPSVPD